MKIESIKLGNIYYCVRDKKPYEVIKETDTCFYLCHFNGTGSKIDYISKTKPCHSHTYETDDYEKNLSEE